MILLSIRSSRNNQLAINDRKVIKDRSFRDSCSRLLVDTLIIGALIIGRSWLIIRTLVLILRRLKRFLFENGPGTRSVNTKWKQKRTEYIGSNRRFITRSQTVAVVRNATQFAA